MPDENFTLDELAPFGTLPDTLDAGAGRIAGTAFFPGGDGLVRETISAPAGIAPQESR